MGEAARRRDTRELCIHLLLMSPKLSKKKRSTAAAAVAVVVVDRAQQRLVNQSARGASAKEEALPDESQQIERSGSTTEANTRGQLEQSLRSAVTKKWS